MDLIQQNLTPAKMLIPQIICMQNPVQKMFLPTILQQSEHVDPRAL